MCPSMFFCYLGKVECADCGNAFRTGYRQCYVSSVIILQNIRGNMIYLFRDYIEIPLVGLLHTTGRRFLICKNIKNGHLYRLFSSDICNSSPKKTYRKPTRNQEMAFYLSV